MTFMTEGNGAGEILKSDKLDRVQVPPERRQAILDEFERSGMSGIAFTRHYGIKYQIFVARRKRRKKAPTEAPARKSGFVLVAPPREVSWAKVCKSNSAAEPGSGFARGPTRAWRPNSSAIFTPSRPPC